MKTIYVFLAEGFEEVEALTPVDVLRRAGLPVKTVSVTGVLTVNGAHGVPVIADMVFEEVKEADTEMIVLPGGLPGAVLKPQGGNCAVLPILSQVAGHLLLLKSSNYSRLVSKEILCTEIQIVLFNKFNTKIALYSRHFTSRFHVFVYQAACQPLPSLSPYQLSPLSLSRQIPSFGRLF